MDEYEGFFRELDRRYSLSLVPRIRIGTVTAVTSPTLYSVIFPGETTARDNVPSVSVIAPQVSQLVRIELVGDDPVIVDVVGVVPISAAIFEESTVVTSQGTTSTSYTNLATAGPAVTVSLIDGQKVEVGVYAKVVISSGGPGHEASMSYEVTGASGTFAAVDDDAIQSQNELWVPGARSSVFTATDSGSHTFTAKYKSTSGDTATFFNRRIIVTT
jgi:hypothetical protein